MNNIREALEQYGEAMQIYAEVSNRKVQVLKDEIKARNDLRIARELLKDCENEMLNPIN